MFFSKMKPLLWYLSPGDWLIRLASSSNAQVKLVKNINQAIDDILNSVHNL